MGNQMNEIKIPRIVCVVPLPLFSFQLSTTSGLWAPDDDGCRSSSSSSSSSGRPVSAAGGRGLPAARLLDPADPSTSSSSGLPPHSTLPAEGVGVEVEGRGGSLPSFLFSLPNKLSLLFRAAESPLPKALLLLPQFPPPPLEREAPAALTWSKIHQRLVMASSSKSTSHQDLGYQSHLLNEVVISCPLDFSLCI